MAASRISSLLTLGEETVKRGWFAVNALKRIVGAEDKRAQFEKEKRYFASHKEAQARRAQHAEVRDSLAGLYGPVLGWNSVRGTRTEPECWNAHGMNFSIYRKPRQGFPGEVHLACRCTSGSPWPDGKMLR